MCEASRLNRVRVPLSERRSQADHPERDIDGTSTTFIVDLWTRKLLGLRYQDDRPGVVWFDAEWATMQKSVDRVLPDTVNLLQRRGDRWIVIGGVGSQSRRRLLTGRQDAEDANDRFLAKYLNPNPAPTK